MSTEPTTMQEMVDGQLASLTITDTAVSATDYKTAHALKITLLKDEAEAVPAPTDKASLQALQDVLTKVTRARTGIDKWRKAWQEPWKKVSDAVNGYLGTSKESGLQAQIASIEEGLEAKKKAYLDEQAKAAREGERIIEERYKVRAAKLVELGMSIGADGNFTIQNGEHTMSVMPSHVRFFEDPQFAEGVKRVEAIAHKIREAEAAALQAKEAQEREEAEERERLRVQKEEQDATAAKLESDRKQLEKELAEMRWQKGEVRASELELLGAIAQCGDTDGYAMEIAGRSYQVVDLADMDDQRWTEAKAWVRDAKVKAIEEQKSREAQAKRAAERGEQLAETGAVQDGEGTWHYGAALDDPYITQERLRTMTSEEWAPVLARFKEAAETYHPKPLLEGDWSKAAEARDNQSMQAVRDALGKVYNEPHNEEEYRADVAEATAIIEQERSEQEGSAVVGSQSDLESGVVSVAVDEDELVRGVLRQARTLAVAMYEAKDAAHSPVIIGGLSNAANACAKMCADLHGLLDPE